MRLNYQSKVRKAAQRTISEADCLGGNAPWQILIHFSWFADYHWQAYSELTLGWRGGGEGESGEILANPNLFCKLISGVIGAPSALRAPAQAGRASVASGSFKGADIGSVAV